MEPRQDVLPLDMGTTAKLQLPAKDPKVLALRAGWLKKKAEIFAGKYHIPDSEDPDIVRHYKLVRGHWDYGPVPRR